MIKWNELRITPDNKKLIIDVSISDSSLYDGINIKEIKVDTDNTFSCTGPSSDAINLDINLDDPRHVRVVVDEDTLNGETHTVDLIKNMLFVYVIVDSNVTLPCGKEVSYEMRTVVNLCSIYNIAMSYIRELSKSCAIPKNYINMFLQFKAIDLCVKTGNYLEAIKLWQKFMLIKGTETISNNCGCNG